MKLFAAQSVVARLAAVMGSAAVHVSFFASMSGGHGAATLTAPTDPMDLIDVVREEEVVPPPQPTAPEPNEHVPTHTHAYPVAPSHDSHPHDESLVHAPVANAAAAPADPPAVIAVAEAAVAAPSFTIALGTSSQTSRVVASGAAHAHASEGTGEPEAVDAVVPESGVSVAARLLSAALPAYPPSARSEEVEAEVPVEIVVDTTGRVTEAKLLRHAGYGFDESALEAVRRYRFSPAQRRGQAVRVRMRWVVQFRLN